MYIIRLNGNAPKIVDTWSNMHDLNTSTQGPYDQGKLNSKGANPTHSGEALKAWLYHTQLSFILYLGGNPPSISKAFLSILSALILNRIEKHFISIICTLFADKLKALFEWFLINILTQPNIFVYAFNPKMWNEWFVLRRISDLRRTRIGIKWWRQISHLLRIKMSQSENKCSRLSVNRQLGGLVDAA